jgi:hypothetical protein
MFLLKQILLSAPFILNILSKLFLGPFIMKIIQFYLKLYFIHILISEFKKGERKLPINNKRGRKLLDDHISTTKNTDLRVNKFYLMREISLKSF